jgi:Mg-chelatase subunit ChlI
MQSHTRTARTGRPERDSQNGTGRTSLPGQDYQERKDCQDRTAKKRTAKKGLPGQDSGTGLQGNATQGRTERREEPERDGQNRTVEQDSQNKTARTRQPERDGQNRISRRVSRTGQRELDCQYRTVRALLLDRALLLEQDSHSRTAGTGQPGQDSWTRTA